MIPLFYIGGVFADSDMQTVLLDMVDTFRYGNTSNKGKTVEAGNIYDTSLYIKYKNSTLTDEVLQDSATKTYIDMAKNFIVDTLSDNKGELSILEYTMGSKDNLIDKHMTENFRISPYPKYTERTNLALAISFL